MASSGLPSSHTGRLTGYQSPLGGLLAALIVCDFLYRMTLPKATSYLMVEVDEQVQARLTRAMIYGR